MAEQYVSNVNEKNLVLNRAKAAVISHDFTTAARLYKQLLRDEPSNVDYLKELGAIYVKNSEDEKAIPYYEQIITFYPHYIEAMNSLGAIFRRLKRYEESINILQRALDEGRQTGAVNYNLGFTYKDMGNYDDAIDAFDAVISENPSDVLAYNHLGSIYLVEKKYDKSIATFKRGLQVDPNHPILNYNLAHCYEEAKMQNDAIRCYDKALKARPGWIDAIKDFSKLLIKSQKTKEAADLVQRSIQLHPNDSKLLGMMGQIYLDQYDYDAAEKAFKRANSVDSRDVNVLRGLAESLEKGEKPHEALETVLKAMELEPENKDIKKQYVHALLSAQEYDAAHDNVQGLYNAQGSSDPQVLDLYGQYCICTNQDDEAQNYYGEIEKNNRQYKDHILSAASRYNQIGKTDDAEKKAKEYIAKAGKTAEGYHVLGKIYENEGNYQKALESFTTSKELFKPNILADKQISHLKSMMDTQPEPEKVEEAPVIEEEEEVVQEVQVPEAAPEEKSDEFDFGTMGDNVPMGEALLEKEDDFFDELDQATEEEVEEEPVEEEEDDDEQPVAAVGGNSPYEPMSLDDLEDENLSPFDDLDEEPKSVGEQLVPEADFSEDDKPEDPSDDFIKNPKMPEPQEPESYDEPEKKSEPAASKEEPFFEPESESAAETASEPATEPASEPKNPFTGLDDEEPFDFGSYGESEPEPYSEPYNEPYKDPYNEPQAPLSKESGYEPEPYKPEPYKPEPSYNQPHEPRMESSMDQFANEMQKRMQDAMMDSAKYAMDAAMNAQKMAEQVAHEQEKLKDKMDSMPQPSSAPAADPVPEPVTQPEPEPIAAPEPEPVVEPEPAVEPEEAFDFGPEPEPVEEPVSEPVVESMPEPEPVIQSEPEPAVSAPEPVSAPAADDSNFANISDILSDLNIEDLADSIASPKVMMTPSAILPKIEKILANEEIAEENSPKLELFKKLLSFREYLSEEERQDFDSGRIRMLLEYIIAKMSGKPGLLKTVQSLIKSGLLGDDYQDIELDEEYEEMSNALVKKVLNIMKDLAQNLEDQNLAKALCNCADSVLERIALEERKVNIF